MKTLVTVAGCLVFSIASIAQAAMGFPDYAKFPPSITLDPSQTLTDEAVAQAEFESTKSGTPKVNKSGRHFRRWFIYQPSSGEIKPGYYNGTEERIYKAVSGTLTASGWQLVFIDDNKAQVVWRYMGNGKEAWLRMVSDAPQALVNFEMIEIAAATNTLVHNPPAAKPEVFTDKSPIPYLTPWPGSTLKSAGTANDPIDVGIAFRNVPEPPVVGQGSVYRHYQGPSNLSQLQFLRDNREALIKAGWKILYPAQSDTSSGIIIARYNQQGRDIWANLTYEYGASISYAVTDNGGQDWAAKLQKDCRLPLYGVLFDFNKTTLKPDSEDVLNRVAALLKQNTGFAVELQGHTDNVGKDDYNQKLSEGRAASVRQWLATHGIDAARMTSKGYGKTAPVADNATDFGRAKNRRVELVRAGCKR